MEIVLDGPGAKKVKRFEKGFSNWAILIRQLKKACDQYGTRKSIQMKALLIRYYFANSMFIPIVQLKDS